MTFSVKVALNPNTVNHSTSQGLTYRIRVKAKMRVNYSLICFARVKPLTHTVTSQTFVYAMATDCNRSESVIYPMRGRDLAPYSLTFLYYVLVLLVSRFFLN